MSKPKNCPIKIGDSYFDELLNFRFCMFPSCFHCFSGFRTILVFALGSFLPILVIVYNLQCNDLTDATLADEDANSILADNANRPIQGNVAMQGTQVASSGGQI